MRRLWPDPGEVDDVAALVASEARPPHADRPWLLVNMVASLDGAITIDERSGGLGGPADKAMFFALRHVADVILVGRRHRPRRGLRPADGAPTRRAPLGGHAARPRSRASRSSRGPSTSIPRRGCSRIPTTARWSFTYEGAPAERRAALVRGRRRHRDRRGRGRPGRHARVTCATDGVGRRHLRGRADPQRRPDRPRPHRRVVPHRLARCSWPATPAAAAAARSPTRGATS